MGMRICACMYVGHVCRYTALTPATLLATTLIHQSASNISARLVCGSFEGNAFPCRTIETSVAACT
jgi:hypothetical protein